ncbi:MAG: GTPase HflX [Aigarchaeota archaeon]|nr:GTPase HflX [Aigarchaeota archaeon]MDW8021947.1 GTPase HflX [Nitrososphaerota archaeon]
MKVAIVHRVQGDEEDNLAELRELCRTAGYEVMYQLKQKRPPHPKYNIGPGKVEELKEAIRELGIEKVIFENDLKPVQEYNLAKALKIPIITRTQLILEIFSLHASSIEAKLQIKLAELKYELSRAKEKVRLAKKGEQPGFHGLGAYEADVYYDEIHRRMFSIAKKLEHVKKHMDLIRVNRKEFGLPLISLAGYTNAGKSTLFNALTNEEVKVSPQLFTTLTPTTRIIRMNGKPAFISDTVGFIKNLPTPLIEAFYATLKEIALSDLILLLADASEPLDKLRERIETSLQILYNIGAHNVPTILVLNKVDLVGMDDAARKAEELDLEMPHVLISAKMGWGLQSLQEMVSGMFKNFIRIESKLPYDGETMNMLNDIYQFSKVNEVSFNDGFVKLDIEAPICLAEKIRRYAMDGEFKIIG